MIRTCQNIALFILVVFSTNEGIAQVFQQIPFAGERPYMKESGFILDFETEPPTLKRNRQFFSINSGSCGFDSLGRLELITCGDTTYNKNEEIAGNGVFNNVMHSGIWDHNTTAVIPNPYNTNQYYVFTYGAAKRQNVSPKNSERSNLLAYRVYDKTLNNGNGGLITSKPVDVSSRPAYGFTAIHHANGRDIWIINREAYGFIVTLISKDGVSKPKVQYYSEDQAKNYFLESSHDGKNIYCLYDRVTPDLDAHRVLKSFYFNDATGDISFDRIMFSQPDRLRSKGYPQYTFLNQIVISPNDSIIYINAGAAILSSNMIWHNGIMQIRRNEAKLQKTLTFAGGYTTYGRGTNVGFGLTVGPNGKIYCIGVDGDSYIGVVEKPNVFGLGCSFRPKAYPLELSGNPNYICGFPKIFAKTYSSSFKHHNVCDMGVVFNSNSDDSFFKSYVLYFGDGDSMVFDNQISSTTHFYQNTGKYFVRLKSVAPSGYFQWYSDTIEVSSIWKRPEARFDIEDTIGCQWVGFHIYNKSKTQVEKTGGYFKWDFGDGTDTTMKVNTNSTNSALKHIYTESGSYDISLVYFNGYCSDTLTQSQVVEILDAPKPGLLLDKKADCAPFGLTVSREFDDLVDSIVIDWGDRTSDSYTDQEIVENQFKHTYTTLGEFTITQKLYGPTGCVTVDKAQVMSLWGFQDESMAKISFVTLDDKRTSYLDHFNVTADITWEKVPQAIKYKLYRSYAGSSETEVKPSSLFSHSDNIPIFDNLPVHYRVEAIDTCEKVISSISHGSITLAGSNKNNERGVVTWTPYDSWDSGVDHYELWEISEGGMRTIVSKDLLTNANEFEDVGFLEQGKKEKCYQIVAVSGDGQFASSSNVLCIPYRPILWVPNSFSPNGDGINDQFKVHGFGIEAFELKIFNRWGELIYYSDNINDPWIGPKSLESTLIYRIRARGTEEKWIHYNGTLNIIK